MHRGIGNRHTWQKKCETHNVCISFLSQLPNLLRGCRAEDIHRFLYYVLKSCLVLGLLVTYRVVDHMASTSSPLCNVCVWSSYCQMNMTGFYSILHLLGFSLCTAIYEYVVYVVEHSAPRGSSICMGPGPQG